jgi:hypothetical protein
VVSEEQPFFPSGTWVEEFHLRGSNYFVLGEELFLLFLQGVDERPLLI